MIQVEVEKNESKENLCSRALSHSVTCTKFTHLRTCHWLWWRSKHLSLKGNSVLSKRMNPNLHVKIESPAQSLWRSKQQATSEKPVLTYVLNRFIWFIISRQSMFEFTSSTCTNNSLSRGNCPLISLRSKTTRTKLQWRSSLKHT